MTQLTDIIAHHITPPCNQSQSLMLSCVSGRCADEAFGHGEFQSAVIAQIRKKTPRNFSVTHGPPISRVAADLSLQVDRSIVHTED